MNRRNIPNSSRLSPLFVLCLLLFTTLLSSTYTIATDRVALVIGNSIYPDQSLFGKIPMAERDADLMATTLRDLDFDVIIVKNASKSMMYSKLLDFETKITEGCTALIYFAGHGIEFEKKNYLIGSNALFKDRDILGEEAIEADVIVKKLTRKAPRTSIIFLDCCREAPPHSWLTSQKKARNASTLGLAEMKTGPGLVIGFAASAGNLANDTLGEENGPYALALTKFMKSGEEFNRVLKLAGREVNARSITMKSANSNELGIVIQEPRMYGQLYHDFFFTSKKNETSQSTGMADLRAQLAEEQSKREKAEKQAAEAISLTRISAEIPADILFNQGDFTRAANGYQIYIRENQTEPNIERKWFYLGLCYENVGQLNDAATTFEHIVNFFKTGECVANSAYRAGLIAIGKREYTRARDNLKIAHRECSTAQLKTEVARQLAIANTGAE